jgi:hypothetical protein
MFPSLGDGKPKQLESLATLDLGANYDDDDDDDMLDSLGGGNWQSKNTKLAASFNSDFAPPRVTLRALFNHEPDEDGELGFPADSLITLIVSNIWICAEV